MKDKLLFLLGFSALVTVSYFLVMIVCYYSALMFAYMVGGSL